jgi:hypothetical protein
MSNICALEILSPPCLTHILLLYLDTHTRETGASELVQVVKLVYAADAESQDKIHRKCLQGTLPRKSRPLDFPPWLRINAAEFRCALFLFVPYSSFAILSVTVLFPSPQRFPLSLIKLIMHLFYGAVKTIRDVEGE